MNQSPDARRDVVVTHALRTPIGKYLGSLADWTAGEMGAHVVRELIARSGVDGARIGEVVFGCGRQAGSGTNVARQVGMKAGLPETVPAFTVNMACGSGLKSIAIVADAIRNGDYDVAVAGGSESMSGLPYFLPRMRRGYRLGHAKVVDAMYHDGFQCPISDMLMGETAEKLAREMDITRDEQDRFALESQNKAVAAQDAGRFDDEIVPVTIRTRKGETVLSVDEHVRRGTKIESLGKLPPVFDRENGTVSAGNASGITDGAAGLLLMARETADELGLQPLAVLGAHSQAGVDPTIMGIGPVPAVRALHEKNGLALGDYDLIELNEAFAAQVLACHRELELPMDRLNVNGGAIALGHPIGATGARIAVTLLHEMNKRGSEHGLATLCISGGQGFASAFHRPS